MGKEAEEEGEGQKMIELAGYTFSAKKWCDIAAIDRSTYSHRVMKGYSDRVALFNKPLLRGHGRLRMKITDEEIKAAVEDYDQRKRRESEKKRKLKKKQMRKLTGESIFQKSGVKRITSSGFDFCGYKYGTVQEREEEVHG